MSVAAWTLQGITDLYVFTAAMSTNSVITRKVDRTPDYIQADRTKKRLFQCVMEGYWAQAIFRCFYKALEMTGSINEAAVKKVTF